MSVLGTILGSTNRFLGTIDGNWGTASNWSYGRLPVLNDNVSIEANCTINIVPSAINQLIILPGFTLAFGGITRTLSVNGNLNCQGVLDLNSAAHVLSLYGIYNKCNSLLTDNNESTVQYLQGPVSSGMSGIYRNIYMLYNPNTSGIKIIFKEETVTVTNNLTWGYTKDVYFTDSTVNLCNITQNNGIIKLYVQHKDVNNYVLITGNITCNATYNNIISIQRNAIFRGNISIPVYNGGGLSVGGVAQFETNNCTLTSSVNCVVTLPIVLINGVVFANNATQNLSHTSINGTNLGSTYKNMATCSYSGTQEPMQTGVLDCTTSGNSFKYNGIGVQSIKGTTYHHLTASQASGLSSVQKTLTGNAIVNGNLTVDRCTINRNGFSLTVTGTTTLLNGGSII